MNPSMMNRWCLGWNCTSKSMKYKYRVCKNKKKKYMESATQKFEEVQNDFLKERTKYIDRK